HALADNGEGARLSPRRIAGRDQVIAPCVLGAKTKRRSWNTEPSAGSLGRSTMLSRRDVLNSALGASISLLQGSQRAPAQGARRIIVDAQVHLWKPESPDWGWVPGLKPQLLEPFTIERLLPMMDEAGVDRVVIVPPSWPGDRNDYALEAVQRYPQRFRRMGPNPLQDPKSAGLLPKWKAQSVMMGVRGLFKHQP